MNFEALNDSLAGFRDISQSLRDPNNDPFPVPSEAKKMSLNDVNFDKDIPKKEIAIEKAIITRKILKASTWDRVVRRHVML